MLAVYVSLLIFFLEPRRPGSDRGLFILFLFLFFFKHIVCLLLFQQLIDLSSPLIKWSPEDKKENSAPLINLSF